MPKQTQGKKDVRTIPIQISVNLHASPQGEKAPEAVAYAFNANGRFLGVADLDKGGQAALKLPVTDDAQDVRIVIGPKLETENVTFSDLSSRGAQQQFVRVSGRSKELRAEFQIASDQWLCWFRFCSVQGTLLKRILSGGIPVDFPVCGAQVQIWDVEPIFLLISRLSVIDLSRIREFLLNPQPLPPNPPDPGPLERARVGQLEVAKPLSLARTFDAESFEHQALREIALSGNLDILRQNLLEFNEDWVRWLICLLFPRFVTKRLIATVTTDRCGNFNDFIFLGCRSSINLYFTASVNLLWFQIPIYDPTPVSCYTHWNYKCGSEVTLYTSSPFAPLCSPCPPVDAPENYVLIRALGNIQLNQIYGTSTLLAGSTSSTNIGQAAELYWGLDSPFGGLVLPRIEFDSSLRANNIAKYYRVRWRYGTSGSFTDLAGPIARKFNHFVGSDLVTSVYPLGPNVVGSTTNLFEIPPALPPGGGDWVFPDPPVDLANAQFPTADLPSGMPDGTFGKYQLELTLFDDAGNEVNIAAKGIGYFVPTTVDSDGTIHTANAADAPLNLVSGNAFIMTVHVDNRHTGASLAQPDLDGTFADPDCGVFHYGAGHSGTVHIPFAASHPDNFAVYSYRLSRGATPLTQPPLPASPAFFGQVSAGTNPALITASVLTLLTHDGTICDIAGFAEDLYVSALATNGWSRLSEYDSSPPPVAFVLAPVPSHP
jgi:hypothetical protein